MFNHPPISTPQRVSFTLAEDALSPFWDCYLIFAANGEVVKDHNKIRIHAPNDAAAKEFWELLISLRPVFDEEKPRLSAIRKSAGE
jgi:hypothetical protein